MNSLPTDRIRNVVLLGQSGAGKTTLAEALLVMAGAVTRGGRVDDGTSVLDTEPESVKRRMSLSLAIAPLEWTAGDGRRCKINLIDCPGYPDFVGEADTALGVADLAVFVVSAVDGVEVHTELLWRRAAATGVARLIFVNKEDKERADFHGVVEQLRGAFGAGVSALELPLGEAGALHGIADLISGQAFEYRSGGRRPAEMPDELAAEEHRLAEALREEIVSGDDEQLERYLGGEVPSASELERTLADEVMDCRQFPVLLGSAQTGVGIDRLADFICDLGPSPDRYPAAVVAGPDDIQVAADSSAKPLVHVFKTLTDPFVGQLSLFKVLSGTVTVDDHLVNSRTGAEERLHGLFQLRGKEQTPVTAVVAGDLAVVAKLVGVSTGDTLAPKGTPVRVLAPAATEPMYAVAIVARTQGDDDKLGNALQRLQAEDAALRVERVEETKQTVMHAMGDTHVSVIVERLARKFGVNVDIVEVRVPYLETITGRAEAEGKVKKQSGGHGQFAIANLRVAPLARGSGVEFADLVVGGAIPRNFIPAVQRGVEETVAKGGVHGFPVVDLRVECFDGKYHAVDSSEMAFRAAAAHGLKQAMAEAGVAVLEPVSLLRVMVPADHQGEVMADIATRRGKVQGTDITAHGEHEVTALVPTSELAKYAIELRSMTAGRGSYTVQHDHYDVLPAHLVAKAIETLPKD